MKADLYDSPRERSTIVTLTVGQDDIRNVLNPREVVLEVRYQIAAKITERIMQRLGPAIDKALAEITPDL